MTQTELDPEATAIAPENEGSAPETQKEDKVLVSSGTLQEMYQKINELEKKLNNAVNGGGEEQRSFSDVDTPTDSATPTAPVNSQAESLQMLIGLLGNSKSESDAPSSSIFAEIGRSIVLDFARQTTRRKLKDYQ